MGREQHIEFMLIQQHEVYDQVGLSMLDLAYPAVVRAAMRLSTQAIPEHQP